VSDASRLALRSGSWTGVGGLRGRGLRVVDAVLATAAIGTDGSISPSRARASSTATSWDSVSVLK
jgi:hypothetical protein